MAIINCYVEAKTETEKTKCQQLEQDYKDKYAQAVYTYEEQQQIIKEVQEIEVVCNNVQTFADVQKCLNLTIEFSNEWGLAKPFSLQSLPE